MSNLHRIRQVVKYGWQHAGVIRDREMAGGAKSRLSLFCDIMSCYQRYGMWSNQYVKERFWELSEQDRDTIGSKYREANKTREAWVKDFYENRKFLSKWSKYEIEASPQKRERRNEAYTQHFKMGKDCVVEYGVEFSRQHHLSGTLKIGNHITFAKKVFID